MCEQIQQQKFKKYLERVDQLLDNLNFKISERISNNDSMSSSESEENDSVMSLQFEKLLRKENSFRKFISCLNESENKVNENEGSCDAHKPCSIFSEKDSSNTSDGYSSDTDSDIFETRYKNITKRRLTKRVGCQREDSIVKSSVNSNGSLNSYDCDSIISKDENSFSNTSSSSGDSSSDDELQSAEYNSENSNNVKNINSKDIVIRFYKVEIKN